MLQAKGQMSLIEAEIANQQLVISSNCAKILKVYQTEQKFFIFMEYLNGVPLSEIIAKYNSKLNKSTIQYIAG